MKRKSTNGNNVGVGKLERIDGVRSSINSIVETNAGLSPIPFTSVSRNLVLVLVALPSKRRALSRA